MRHKKNLLPLLLTGTALAGLTISANAALIAYEGFATPPYSATNDDFSGYLDQVNTPGSLGFTGSWSGSNPSQSNTAFALSYSTLETTGAGARIGTNAGPGRGQYNFATPFTAGTAGTFYFSWLQSSGTPSGGFSAVEIYDGTVSDSARIIKAGPNGFGSAWTINALEGPDVFAPGNYPYTQNTTMLYVMKLTLSASPNSDLIEFLVNPSTSALGGADPGSDVNTDGLFKTAASGVNFTADRIGIAAFNGGTADFDEFRIGTTFASATPIPEPSSLLLLGAGGLLAFKRRRSQA